MYEVVEANWLLILLAFLIGLAIAWYVFNVRRKTRVQTDRRDVLDEGAERAKRNQAFLDAPPRPAGDTAAPPATAPPADAVPLPRSPASMPPPGALGGAGTAVNAAAGTPEVVTRPEDETDVLRPAAGAAAEPVDPAAPASASSPSVEIAAAPPVPNDSNAHDLTRLKGIGPKLAARLHELGVDRLEQIAAWDDAEIDRIDAQLDRFQGRIRRDDWVTQARLLSAGDQAGYEEKFGRL